MAITVPIVNINQLFKVWKIADIYTGPSGTGQYVPNPGDLVFDIVNGFYTVSDVNYTTNLSTLLPWTVPQQVNGVVANDTLLGAGPGNQSQSFRVYIDTSVSPYTLAVDGRLRVYPQNAAYAKIFSGTNIGATGVVIGTTVNSLGVPVSTNIPLVPAVSGGGMVVQECASLSSMNQGDTVTVVLYDSSGNVLSYATLLVDLTNFIMQTSAYQKYITSIQLISQWISPSNNTLVEIPANMTLQAGMLQGRVSYNDGTSITMPIDGIKFQVQGLQNYVATVVGQQIPLVLQYNLSSNEYGAGVMVNGSNRFITANYNLTTTNVVGAYSVKIYVVPVWNSTTGAYTLQYWMYNLDRTQIYNVTPYVTLVSPNNVFNGVPNGNQQALTLQLNLANVSGAGYAYYNFVTTVYVTLMAPGNTDPVGGLWAVQYSVAGPQVGGAMQANFTLNGSNWNIDLTGGKSVLADWLNGLYYNGQPLYNPTSETGPITPSNFRVLIGGTVIANTLVSNWNVALTNIALTSPNPVQGGPLQIEFYYTNGTTTSELGMGVMPIQII